MGVITYTEENTSPIPPARMFKALFLDSHNLIPKLLPQVVKSIEIIQGDGGAGSITQITFAKGTQLSSVKNRIDEINKETYSYKYTVIEGDALADKLEFASFEVQLEATPDGGNKTKMTSKYHTKGDSVITEEEIKAGKEQTQGIYKVVEGYLLQNPDAYA